jgi:hypothetical protein
MKQFHRPQRRVLRERGHQDVTIRFGLRRSPNLPTRPLGRVIDRCDVGFRGDAPHGPHRHPAQGRNVLPRVPRPPKHLHLVSLEHVDHLSLAGDGISDDCLAR